MNFIKDFFIFIYAFSRAIFRLFSKIVKFLIKWLFINLAFIAIIVYFVNYRLSRENKNLKQGSYIELKLDKHIREDIWKDPSFDSNELSLFQILEVIDTAKNDNRVKGIIIGISPAGSSIYAEHADEIADSLKRFKKLGKEIIIHAEDINDANYRLAVHATKVIMSPSSSSKFKLAGYETAAPYYKKLLDKIGVKAEIYHTGDHKTAYENFAKSKMSQAGLDQIYRTREQVYKTFLLEVAANRKINFDKLFNGVKSGEYLSLTSEQAKKSNFVDLLAFYNEVILKMKKSSNIISAINYFNLIKKSNKGNIGIIYLEGDINRDSAEYLLNIIEKAIEDKSIKGIVFRINSGGGAVYESELLKSAITRLHAVKPIYVSMGAYAASGGYLIATDVDKIFANSNTITGSIGVVSMSFNLKELFNKIGINYEIVSENKDTELNSVFGEITDKRREINRKNLEYIYSCFKNHVAKGRGMKPEAVDKVAGGRVWTGTEALSNGLIDEIGGLEKAVSAMAKKLNVSSRNTINLKNNWYDTMKRVFKSKTNAAMNLKSFKILDQYKELEEYNNRPLMLMLYSEI